MRMSFRFAVGCVGFIAGLPNGCLWPIATAQEAIVEPGGDQQSAADAANKSDEFAWRLFEFVTRQAVPGTAGVPDPSKALGTYDPDTPTVFETWGLASGDGRSQAGAEVFKEDGSEPVNWAALPRGAPQVKVFSANLKQEAVAKERLLEQIQRSPEGRTNSFESNLDLSARIGPLNPDADFEVRLNEAAYDFVKSDELYNVEGLQKQLANARKQGKGDLIQFPAAAKEIKANWVQASNPGSISDDERQRYHWRRVSGIYYLLTGFHITTKDLKQWFWADFAQEDFETKPGPALQSRDTTTRGTGAPARGSKDGVRRELEGTKWGYYRLRGTQTTFVDSNNAPIIVGNTMIEPGFANRSSCMTCHFRASVGDGVSSGGTVNTLSGGKPDVGTPDPGQFGSGGTFTFIQNDFEWSAPFRARHKQ
jgi:hypothetical protein